MVGLRLDECKRIFSISLLILHFWPVPGGCTLRCAAKKRDQPAKSSSHET